MAYIDEKQIEEAFETARIHMKQFFDPLDELERLARNKPHANVIKAKLPTVTDGTLAAAVQAQPRRTIQQLPTGRIISFDDPDLAPYVNYIWLHLMLPNMKTGGTVMAKCWAKVQRALTYGSQPSYSFFTQNGDYTGSDFVLPYIKDVFPESGKLYANDSKYMFMRSWWTESQLRQLIDKENLLTEKSKARGKDAYSSNWKVDLLKKLADMKQVKPQEAQSAKEREGTGTRAIYIELIHVFQEGKGANFYVWSRDLKQVVRTRKNPDPRGLIPIRYLYAGMDNSNPLGRGPVELSGGMQNLLDSEMQAYQLMQRIMMQPPLMKWGSTIDKSTIKWAANNVIDMGSDANSKLEALTVNSEALANFPTNYGLMKSQILQLSGNQDSSISSQSGNPSFSKTSAGVKQQESRVNIDDNYIRKQFEDDWQEVSEGLLNIHFAESTGSREIELTEEFLEELYGDQEQADMNAGADQQPGQPRPLKMQSDKVKVDPVKKQATIIYDDIKTKFAYKVNPSSSEAPDDQEQQVKLQELVGEAGTNLRVIQYFLAQDGYDLKPGEIYRQQFQNIGLEGIDRIMPRMSPEKAAKAKQQPFPIIDMPHVRIDANTLPPAALSQILANSGVNVPPEALTQPPDPTAALSGKQQLPVESPNYDKWPEDVKRQAEAASGFQPSTMLSPAGSQQFEQHASAMDSAHQADQTAQQAQQTAQQQQAQPQQQASQPPANQQAGPTPEDHQLIEQFVHAGFSLQQAMEAVQMMHQGATHDQIMQQISGGQP